MPNCTLLQCSTDTTTLQQSLTQHIAYSAKAELGHLHTGLSAQLAASIAQH